MTGFGQSTVSSKEIEYQVSIRAVNGRYLEPRFHLPKELHPLESHLRKILEKYFNRGTVDIYFHRRHFKAHDAIELTVQEDLIEQYLKIVKTVSKKYKIKSALTTEFLLKQPDFIKIESKATFQESENEWIEKVFVEACKKCQKEKEREGKALQKEMLKWIDTLVELRAEISKERESVNQILEEKYKKRVQERLADFASGASNIDPQRISQEIVLQLDRCDINEELQRLEEHLSEFKKLVNGTEGVGKKLDFYTQELLREVNTVGSKSQVAKLTGLVVQAKTIVEKIREQVQNIE